MSVVADAAEEREWGQQYKYSNDSRSEKQEGTKADRIDSGSFDISERTEQAAISATSAMPTVFIFFGFGILSIINTAFQNSGDNEFFFNEFV